MLYDYTGVTVESVTDATETAVKKANELVDRAVAGDRTIEGTLLPLNDAAAEVAIAYGRGAFMARVHPDGEIRDTATRAEETLNKWGIDVVFRQDLSSALKELAATNPDGSPEQLRLLEFWLRDFRRAGHDLNEQDQAELRKLRERLVELSVAFQANIDAFEDFIEVTREELDGLPASYIDALKPGDAEGTYRVTLDYPELYPFLENSHARRRRQELLLKRNNMATDVNRPLLEEALQLRRRVAQLVGYESWSHHSMDVKMAKHPDRVQRFYDSLIPKLQEKVDDEHIKMKSMLVADEGTDELHHWDVAYYTTKIRREEFGVDQYEVAEYFPLQAVLDGLFSITSAMFGLRYEEIKPARAWSNDVSLFEIFDADTDEHLAYFYLDLFPREGKFGHAAAFDLVPGHQPGDGEYLRPIAAMVANFTKPTASAPSLLRHDEVVTIFHEFGHILHQTLTTAETVRFSGANTEWDFVEAPSQIMEHWCWDPEVLRQFSRHYQTGEKIPTGLVEQLVAARDVNVAVFNLRQAFFGVMDLQIHDDADEWDLDKLDRTTFESVYKLPFPEGTFFLAGFGHIMGGYDAGYYGYLWSKVFGDDMYSRFQEEGALNPAVGRDYRRTILEAGGTKDADELLVDFLGREPSNEAFLRNLGIEE